MLNEQNEKAIVRCPVNGRVIEWNVATGDPVEIGQLLGTVLKVESEADQSR